MRSVVIYLLSLFFDVFFLYLPALTAILFFSIYFHNAPAFILCVLAIFVYDLLFYILRNYLQ